MTATPQRPVLPPLTRRHWLTSALAWAGSAQAQAPEPEPSPSPLAAAPAAAAEAAEAAWAAPLRIVAAWRGPHENSPQHLGVMALHPRERAARIERSVALPGRAHGLAWLPDGRLLASAVRPGAWLVGLSPDGQRRLHRLDAEGSSRLSGHLEASDDGRLLYTAQAEGEAGEGVVVLRDAADFTALARWPSGGVEPHDLRLDGGGSLWIAHGGIRRDGNDARRQGTPMEPSLVRMDARSGALTGRWTLDDPRLSLRHLALHRGPDGHAAAVGVALQAEHDAAWQRQQAPVLAIWEPRQVWEPRQGQGRLRIACRSSAAMGLAGDLCTLPQGGFALSNHRLGRAFGWSPQQPDQLEVLAELRQAQALASLGEDGPLVIAAAAGLGVWQRGQPARAWAWPEALAADNHARLLAQA